MKGGDAAVRFCGVVRQERRGFLLGPGTVASARCASGWLLAARQASLVVALACLQVNVAFSERMLSMRGGGCLRVLDGPPCNAFTAFFHSCLRAAILARSRTDECRGASIARSPGSPGDKSDDEDEPAFGDKSGDVSSAFVSSSGDKSACLSFF